MEQQWTGFVPDAQEFKLGLSIVACLLIGTNLKDACHETYFCPNEMRPTSASDINQQLTHLQNQLNERLS